ncbi:MAG: polysaccharide deacetylase family protein [Luteolibacter sp.]|jgi:peptidoglycan/xylan/chitin deacetylase (PgdA/CDA1 family)|nr:polysaccharide deacetylase family protein [Luteolibacter sp.]
MKTFTLFLTLLTGICLWAEDLPPPAAPVETPLLGIPDDGARVAILGYHDFSETEPETAMRIRTSKFRKQMETIRQLGITVISLHDFVAWKHGDMEIPEKSALITLDDGWKSVYTDAFPILKEFGYPFSLYLYKNYVDGGGKALTTQMIQEMITAGAAIGSHSVSHPYPVTVKSFRKKGSDAFDAYLRKEMGESKRFLESKFKTTVITYAYPGGFHTEEMYALGVEFGYTHLFTVIPGKVTRQAQDNTIPRYMILGNYDKIFEFATTFRDSQNSAAPSGAIAGLIQTTPHPVHPEPGAIINSRLPEISADLSKIDDFDPATLVMKVSGFGEVPASFSPGNGKLSWQVNRRLRQNTCQVSINWKDRAGKDPESPLRWTFQIDRDSAYLPDGE